MVALLAVVQDELLLVPLLFPTLLVPIELAMLSSVRVFRALDATTECTGKRIVDSSDGKRPGSERPGIALMPKLGIECPGSLTIPSAPDLMLLVLFFFFFRCTGNGGTMPISVSFALPMPISDDMIGKLSL